VTVVDELEVHVDKDRVEDQRQLVPVQVEGTFDEFLEVLNGKIVFLIQGLANLPDSISESMLDNQ